MKSKVKAANTAEYLLVEAESQLRGAFIFLKCLQSIMRGQSLFKKNDTSE